MVQEKGLEPPLPFGNWILSPVRLPIPPLLQSDISKAFALALRLNYIGHLRFFRLTATTDSLSISIYTTLTTVRGR